MPIGKGDFCSVTLLSYSRAYRNTTSVGGKILAKTDYGSIWNRVCSNRFGRSTFRTQFDTDALQAEYTRKVDFCTHFWNR